MSGDVGVESPPSALGSFKIPLQSLESGESSEEEGNGPSPRGEDESQGWGQPKEYIQIFSGDSKRFDRALRRNSSMREAEKMEEKSNDEDLKAHREFVVLERKLSEGGGLQGFKGDSKRFNRSVRRESSRSNASKRSDNDTDDDELAMKVFRRACIAQEESLSSPNTSTTSRVRKRFGCKTQIGLLLDGVKIIGVAPHLANSGGPMEGCVIVSVDGTPANEGNVKNLLLGSDEPGTVVSISAMVPADNMHGFPFTTVSSSGSSSKCHRNYYLTRLARDDAVGRGVVDENGDAEDEEFVRVASEQQFTGDTKRRLRMHRRKSSAEQANEAGLKGGAWGIVEQEKKRWHREQSDVEESLPFAGAGKAAGGGPDHSMYSSIRSVDSRASYMTTDSSATSVARRQRAFGDIAWGNLLSLPEFSLPVFSMMR